MEEIDNPLMIDINKFKQISCPKITGEYLEMRKNSMTRSTAYIILGVISILYFLIYKIHSIGLAVLSISIVTGVVLLVLQNKLHKIKLLSYSKCDFCGSPTIQSKKYNSDDINRYFCQQCKTYFIDYHIYPRN